MNRTWLRLQSKLHSFVYRMTNGRIGSQFGAPVLLITTTGRKSGQLRTNPLYYVEDGQNWCVVASNAGSDKQPAWWLNMRANPTTHIQVEAERYRVTGRAATAEEKARLWPQFLQIFSGYDAYQQLTTREFPVVILERN